MLVQMLNCISGMVEKTQRAISILQQRQAEAGSARSAEELVADIQARASSALMEVKLAALEEIRAAKQGAADTAQPGQQSKNKDEVRLDTKLTISFILFFGFRIKTLSFEAPHHCLVCKST